MKPAHAETSKVLCKCARVCVGVSLRVRWRACVRVRMCVVVFANVCDLEVSEWVLLHVPCTESLSACECRHVPDKRLLPK
jgi:hypothetical protein